MESQGAGLAGQAGESFAMPGWLASGKRGGDQGRPVGKHAAGIFRRRDEAGAVGMGCANPMLDLSRDWLVRSALALGWMQATRKVIRR